MKKITTLLLSISLILSQLSLLALAVSTAPLSFANIPAHYDLSVGPTLPLTIPAHADLRAGQVWTGKAVTYDEAAGTAVITLYVWGRTYTNAAGGQGLLGGNQTVTITDSIGEFQAMNVSPAGVLNASARTLTWIVDEADIIGPAPFEITYTIFLDEVEWRTNYWYSTAGAVTEMRFEPGLDNPFYWTKEERTYFEFTADMNWNNGGGLNSGTITDNILHTTITFGSNNSPANQTAASVPFRVPANQRYWAYNARTQGQTYYWHLQWTKNTPKVYYFTVHELAHDVDGAPIDITYEIALGGPGGNTAVPGGRTLTSDTYFRRTFEEGDQDNLFEWDAAGFLVYRADVIAQMMLTEGEVPAGTLTVEKSMTGWYALDWPVNNATQFTARLRTEAGYLALNHLGGNQFSFSGFVGAVELATPITFSVNVPAAITNLPTRAALTDPPLQYTIEEFFTFETIDRVTVTYSIDGGAFQATNSFPIIANSTRAVRVQNDFDHGIGFLEVYKLLDGFPSDWGIDDDTVFYVRIWDVEAENYLLFDPNRTFAPESPFYGTVWCIGSHAVGQSEFYSGNVVMEIPISVNAPVRLSNLWTWGSYEVREVRRVSNAPADVAAMNTAWNTFWTTTADRRPSFTRAAADWDASSAWLEAWMSNNWAYIEAIESDAAWHAREDWNWGVIYSESNGREDLQFNETIVVTVTNRYKFHGGSLMISKELTDTAADWGVTADTTFYVNVRTDDDRLLVFVPHNNYSRVIGFITDGGDYTVLCPVGSSDMPANARTELGFSVNSPAVLIEIPVHPYTRDFLYTVEEVFPAGRPFGITEISYLMAGGLAMPETGFAMFDNETITLTVRNTFAHRPTNPPPPPGDFFVDDHIWYIRGYNEGPSVRTMDANVQTPNNFSMRPDANITRAEVAVAFYRLLRPEWKDFVVEYVPFSDVQGGEWFGLAVGVLEHFGILQGSNGLFRPHAPITRQELAALVSRFDNLAETDVNPYTDVVPGSWAYHYILSATEKGWFVGFPDGTFRPRANLTRAEFVTATNRVLGREILLEDIPDGVVTFIDLDGTHWAHAAFMEATHSHDWERHENGTTERWLAITGHGLDAAYNR